MQQLQVVIRQKLLVENQVGKLRQEKETLQRELDSIRNDDFYEQILSRINAQQEQYQELLGRYEEVLGQSHLATQQMELERQSLEQQGQQLLEMQRKYEERLEGLQRGFSLAETQYQNQLQELQQQGSAYQRELALSREQLESSQRMVSELQSLVEAKSQPE